MKKIICCLAMLLIAFLSTPTGLQAQCGSKNTAFKSGETLIYDLYFNWQFIWIKVGSASMNTTETIYDGKPAFKNYLITRGSKTADKFFVMRDTLTTYTGLDLVPLYYKKGAFEEKTYRKNEAWYSYEPGLCKVKMRYQRNDNEPEFNNFESEFCAYDMLSMMMRARSFDPKKYKKGHRIKFVMADGKRCEWQNIVYQGKEKIKMENNDNKYRCLVFSFMEKEKDSDVEKEIVRFFITDDDNHLPVRLDMNLKIGAAKAFLKGARGLRNPQEAKL